MVDQDSNEPGGAMDADALDALSVAPPPPSADDEAVDDGAADDGADAGRRATPEIREGMDAGDSHALRRNPSDDSGKLDIALDESFPTSDAPSNTQPGKGKDPAPSSGYDEAAEAERAKG